MQAIKCLLVLLVCAPTILAARDDSYLNYHHQIVLAEENIVKRQFSESLQIYRNLADRYEFMFLRDCKVAAQIAALSEDVDNLFFFLEKGMKQGWLFKDIKGNDHFKKFKSDVRWLQLKDSEGKFKTHFYGSINTALRTEVRAMLTQDQKRAIRVALTPVKKWRERYTNRKFVPNNRTQVRRINAIIDQVGFPGEKIIGDKSWATVIISHNEHDTIYKVLRPKLYEAFKRGEISAIELAMVETWRTVVETDRRDKSFIIWNEEVTVAEAAHADSLRQSIGLRSIALNNSLIQTQHELKVNFYLTPFHGGIITVRN